jgi:DegV family protein with EDD domain
MPSLCILTDSSVQFSQPSFPGRNLVHILPLSVVVTRQSGRDEQSLRVNELPASATEQLQPRLLPPSPDTIRRTILALGQSYDEVLAILTSSKLCQVMESAQDAIKLLHGRIHIQFIDSQTTSIGLGILVQTAAETAARGETAFEIERQVRNLLPHIYAAICVPGLSYLHYAGLLDHAQATVGELIGLNSIFSIEEGRLSPVIKVRSIRQAYDYFQEFLDEFDYLKHIGLMQRIHHNPSESRLLREHAQNNYSRTSFTEHSINLPLAILFGPTATGLFIIEDPGQANRISRE